MKLSFFQRLRQSIHKEKIKADKKLMIYGFFVILAMIFWFLNALSKEYTTNVSYPVDYVDFPKEKVLVNELPSHLTLRVRAFGFDLLRYKMSTTFLPITFNVNAFTDKKIEKSKVSRFNLPTSHIKERISRQLSSQINLLSVSPDTLIFEFSNIVHRKVAVKADLDLDFEKQFMLGGIVSVQPDSVVVSGAGVIVDTLSLVTTRHLEFKKLSKSVRRNVSLEKYKGVQYDPKRVVVNIPVEQFTEAEKNVDIEVENLPDSLELRVFPNKVKVSYLVALSQYETIAEDQFRVVVDFPVNNNTPGNRLKVRMVQVPGIVRNVRFYPQTVEYIIEKKDPVSKP